PEKLNALTERPKSFADYVPKGGGDQLHLLQYAAGKAGAPVEITAPGLDLWRPTVAVDGDGAVVVVWSENREGNWDLYQRTFVPEKRSLSEPKRLTQGAGTDTDPVLATAPDGKVWLAWQSWSDGRADILLSPLNGPVSTPVRIGESAADE